MPDLVTFTLWRPDVSVSCPSRAVSRKQLRPLEVEVVLSCWILFSWTVRWDRSGAQSGQGPAERCAHCSAILTVLCVRAQALFLPRVSLSLSCRRPGRGGAWGPPACLQGSLGAASPSPASHPLWFFSGSQLSSSWHPPNTACWKLSRQGPGRL